MAEEDNKMDDLEDGEIESDPEQQNDSPAPAAPAVAAAAAPSNPVTAAKSSKETPSDTSSKNKTTVIENENVKSIDKKEKKKSKEHSRKSDKERRPHVEKPREFSPSNVEDDFARNIEKAIRMELKKGGDSSTNNGTNENNDSGLEDPEKRKHKKRKKHDHHEKEKDVKRKKHSDLNLDDGDVDEDEFMCVRGASPIRRHKRSRRRTSYHSDDEFDSYPSDASDDRNNHGRDRMHNRMFRGRGVSRDFFRKRFDRPRFDKNPLQDPDGVCLFYMQGKCYRGDDCVYSHDARPPRKMELCKFYLMGCCAKRSKCLYLHSDFPCKFYHTGLPCVFRDDCKFAHGKPLSENLKSILIKHIESAPKEILGDFPRLSREAAQLMVTNTQKRLQKEYQDTSSNKNEKGTNSSDEQNLSKTKTDENAFSSNESMNRDKNKRNKVRQSRWCDTSASNAAQNVLCIQNLSGVLTSKQISDLINMGIENINQLTNLTVSQLNQLGLAANQINDIQLNTKNIQQLGLIDKNQIKPTNAFLNKVKSKDLDMRVSPIMHMAKETSATSPRNDSEILGQDVDMRFQSTISSSRDKDNRILDSSNTLDPRKQKNSIDIDQYTKDALKFSSLEKEGNTIKSPKETDEAQDLDVDHRVLKYVRDATTASVKLDEDTLANTENDTDIRISSLPIKQQQMYARIQKNEEKSRRPTTDDEDDILQIDEKWYSSDEDNVEKPVSKIKSPKQSDEEMTKSATSPQAIEPTIVLKNLGDLSKIDISDEVTKLLTSMKNTTENSSSKKEYLKSRDPRNAAKSQNDNKDSNVDNMKKIISKPEFVSIYDCAENSNPDARRRADVDLRPTKDLDFRLPSFGDTDLRQTPGGADIDLRLGLNFKAIPNYTPATEINGSIGAHPPITYKICLIDIPKPDYTDIKNSTPKSQAHGDPRLRKIFRLSFDDSPSEPPSEKSSKQAVIVRSDPRKKLTESVEKQVVAKPAPLDLPTVIQASEWYKDLNSNYKILVNQQLAAVSADLKQFHLDDTPGKFFNLSKIKSNNILCTIFSNLGIFPNESGEFYRMTLPDNSMLNPSPMNFNANPEMFMGGMMDNMNMMALNSMGAAGPMGNMNNMGNFNPRFQMGDSRGAPVHGMPPGMQPNFDYGGGISNFNSDNNYNNYDNTMYNGPVNNGNDYMDEFDDNYYSDHNNEYQNSYRGGRSNDRWNRGRSRGRDRRGYTERANWKNDRN
ncbi:suppressor of sable RNA-binding protein [Arctopsyche grandis]|uniref:suppressor of sable RNA-binding protein n=1 Tax=Arctopsyche grandis TaxID=121162 RepID=UPI00406D7FE4